MFQKLKDFFYLHSKKSLAVAGLFSLVLILISNIIDVEVEPRARNFYFSPPAGIEHFQFGFQESTADALWIRVIQDFDFCEELAGEKICKGSGWVYQIIHSISRLSPHFRDAIYFGGLMLTVVVNDIEGASKIFNRAVELFPDDWPILYAAAYQAMVEEKDQPKAGRLLQAAASHGAPAWVYALATKMYMEAGQQEMGERLYESLKHLGMSEEILQQVRKRLNQQKN